MIADDKKTGNISHGIKQATYMLDPAAKSPQNKMGEKESNPDRVLLVITEHALPVLASSPPKASARQFMQSINEWNRRHRNGQKPPARSWQHIAISFSPKDHEQVSPKRAVAIACHALRLVAGGKRPVLYVVHGDTQHVHVHLQFGTVNDKGKIHSIHRDYDVWLETMAQLEHTYNLTRVSHRRTCTEPTPGNVPGEGTPTGREYHAMKRTGKPSGKAQIRSILDQTILQIETVPEHRKFARFVKALKKAGVGLSANIRPDNHVAGIRFYHGIFSTSGIKGSQLARNYSWPRLAQHNGFQPENPHHIDLLKAADIRVLQWLYTLRRKAGTQNEGAKPRTITPAEIEIPEVYPQWLQEYLNTLKTETCETTNKAVPIRNLVSRMAMRARQLYQACLRKARRGWRILHRTGKSTENPASHILVGDCEKNRTIKR